MERLHKVSAGFVFAFLCLHFANHLIGLEGIDAYSQFMDAARLVYRHPVVEMAVLLAFLVQIISGVPLIREIWTKKKDFVHQLQALSGLIMLVFILAHVAWIAFGRLILHIDTNFYYVAAFTTHSGWKYPVWALFGAGVFSLFVHFGCIAYDIYKKTNRGIGYALLILVVGLGGYVTWMLIRMYAGELYPIHLPADYIQMTMPDI
jgi:hypothetical protein